MCGLNSVVCRQKNKKTKTQKPKKKMKKKTKKKQRKKKKKKHKNPQKKPKKKSGEKKQTKKDVLMTDENPDDVAKKREVVSRTVSGDFKQDG